MHELHPTAYCIQRMSDRGVSLDDVHLALTHELRRAVQPDGRIRIWGWVAARNQCVRLVLEADGVTLVNAFPDRKCTSSHLTS